MTFDDESSRLTFELQKNADFCRQSPGNNGLIYVTELEALDTLDNVGRDNGHLDMSRHYLGAAYYHTYQLLLYVKLSVITCLYNCSLDTRLLCHKSAFNIHPFMQMLSK